jgi:PAS domain S-box-containing protein
LSNEAAGKKMPINNEILYSLREGFIMVDSQGSILQINPAAEKMLNIGQGKALGKRISGMVPGSPLTNVLETGKEISPWHETRGGKQLLSYHFPIRSDGKLEGGYSIYLDITELEEKKLQFRNALQKEKELEAILENSHDGIWIMDGAGVTLRVSKSWEDFSGIKREEMVNRSVYEIVSQGYYTDSAAIHVIEQRKPVTIMYETKTNRKALVTATPVFEENGNIWRIISNVRDITEMDRYRQELEESKRYREELKLLRKQQYESDGVIVRSQAMRDVFKLAGQTAGSDATVLILGESGVGKDVVARYIHRTSNREKGPYIRVNCGAIPEALMESELFGYEEGSFTGARKKGKPGMFELAHGGTLFLDEVGEIPIQMQAKLLHALQDLKVMRVGGMKPVDVDIRVIAATNQDLKGMVDKGEFRSDLYYRLNVIPVNIPSLRDRPEDIIPLLIEFLRKFNEKYNMQKTFSSAALECIVKYKWPGNVRELQNVTERLVLTCSTDIIDVKNLLPILKETPSLVDFHLSDLGTLKEAREELEKSMVSWALKRYGSTRKAASALGVTQPTVVRMSHKYGLNKNRSTQT